VEHAALGFKGQVLPSLLEVGLDLSQFAFLACALGAHFEQGFDTRLAAFDPTHVPIGLRPT
jgi:hypothetical protein